jgi:hypothetical protein
MVFNIVFFVVGLLFLVFRRGIGDALFAVHQESGLPVKKEGYPYIVGGLGGAFVVFSIVMTLVERIPSK